MQNKYFLLIIFSLTTFSPAYAQWVAQKVNTTANFRAVHTANEKVCWIGGSKGTVIRTIDSGATWRVQTVPNADSLDFRDVHAFDGKVAILMSAGEGEKGKAKIYKTTDGGKTWKIVFQTQEKGVFLDGIDFWDKKNGIAFGDPIGGKFYILLTNDGGNTWNRISPDKLPAVQIGEAAFAASGTSIVTFGKSSAWIGTGGGKVGRTFFTHDRGQTWQVSETLLKAGKSAGIFGLRFWDKNLGIAIGGDYVQTKDASSNINSTQDGGKTWQTSPTTQPAGLKEAVAIYKKKILIAVGDGTCYSTDFGKNWTKIDDSIFHAVSFAGKIGFAVGGKGAIVKFDDKIIR
ncbi:MAG: oxidoreductase [Cytophagales bacterium]|nr:MAG: oxidoreductase [Cytophagales bacterium]